MTSSPSILVLIISIDDKLVFRISGNEIAIIVEHFGFRQKTDIIAVVRDDWHIEILGSVEFFKQFFPRIGVVDELFRFNHQFVHQNFVVEGSVKNFVPMVVHHQKSREFVVLVQHDEQVSAAFGDILGVFAQGAMKGQSSDIVVNNTAPVDFFQGVFVFIVSLQISFFRQNPRIN